MRSDPKSKWRVAFEVYRVVDGEVIPKISRAISVHEPVHPKEIQSQQRIRNKILLGESPRQLQEYDPVGLFCGTFWADIKALELSEITSTCPLRKRVRVVWSRLCRLN
ncbi:hypothetical protein AVEN_274056-1 [Araneus ventricosus]|uniref:Uncharacterized protein n=1 Tax=Araneus ventricosus TaxID=182803 RepID=A0A4Y2MFH9_ARAVE|nr:hypothetical protein AVEN_274056-1 [Araneus ventricosus]